MLILFCFCSLNWYFQYIKLFFPVTVRRTTATKNGTRLNVSQWNSFQCEPAPAAKATEQENTHTFTQPVKRSVRSPPTVTPSQSQRAPTFWVLVCSPHLTHTPPSPHMPCPKKRIYTHIHTRAHSHIYTSAHASHIAAWRRTVNPLRLLSACVVVSWRWRPLMVLAGLQRFVATAVVSNKWATARSQCNRKKRRNKSKIKWKVPSKSCAVLVVVRICMYIVCMYGQWDHCIGESELLTLTFLSEKLPLEWVWQCLRERPFQGVWRPVEVRYVCVAVYYTQRSQLDVIVIFNW